MYYNFPRFMPYTTTGKGIQTLQYDFSILLIDIDVDVGIHTLFGRYESSTPPIIDAHYIDFTISPDRDVFDTIRDGPHMTYFHIISNVFNQKSPVLSANRF